MKISKQRLRLRLLLLIAVFALLIPLILRLRQLSNDNTQEAEASRSFPETGKVVRGKFLEYWENKGGAAEFGLPISW